MIERNLRYVSLRRHGTAFLDAFGFYPIDYFGCVGDNHHDNYANLQVAITESVKVGYQYLFVPAGEYYFKGTLEDEDEIIFVGNAEHARIYNDEHEIPIYQIGTYIDLNTLKAKLEEILLDDGELIEAVREVLDDDDRLKEIILGILEDDGLLEEVLEEKLTYRGSRYDTGEIEITEEGSFDITTSVPNAKDAFVSISGDAFQFVGDVILRNGEPWYGIPGHSPLPGEDNHTYLGENVYVWKMEIIENGLRIYYRLKTGESSGTISTRVYWRVR